MEHRLETQEHDLLVTSMQYLPNPAAVDVCIASDLLYKEEVAEALGSLMAR